VKHIGGPLRDLLEGRGLSEGIAGWRAVAIWSDAVGKEIATHSRASRFVDGTLYVEVENSVWLQELSYLRRELAGRLNARLGRDAIRSVHLVLAGGGRRERKG
jgi:predicted nucleic acid-binding Zn ribbon protein